MRFDYDHLEFRYEPFPIGCARPLMDAQAYQDLLDAYPPLEIFANIPKLGDKYSLSERYNPKQYRDWIASNALWRELHGWIKSDAFIDEVLATLSAHHLDLGYKKQEGRSLTLGKRLKEFRRGRLWADPGRLQTRFEFSMLPADGGHLLPHTDTPEKVVTLIVSMVGEGEWDPAFGGGTDVNQAKESRFSYNWLNRQSEFEDMSILQTYEFQPNQGIIFVKTHNSWHSVRPMTGHGSKALRRTLTINIERED